MSTIRVTNSTELQTALKQAVGGDTIVLKAGDYGTVLIRDLKFSEPVTIVSEDSSNPAHIDRMTVSYTENLNFQSIDFGSALSATETQNTALVSIMRSSGISIDKSVIHGSLDGDPGNDGYGLVVRDLVGFSVTNTVFHELGRGVVFSFSSDINVLNNDFSDLRSDGANFAQVQNVIIDNNSFRDFYPVYPDHPDAIQFWTKGTTVASSNIVITNNTVMQGDGTALQGIFLRDELGTLRYENVLIQNNLVYVTEFYNGITVMGGNNLSVLDNTVLSPTGDQYRLRIRLEDITDGSVLRNVADIFLNSRLSGVEIDQNISLDTKPSDVSLIPGINDGKLADISDLLIDGVGYHPPVQDSIESSVGLTLGSSLLGAMGLSAQGAQVESRLAIDEALTQIDLVNIDASLAAPSSLDNAEDHSLDVSAVAGALAFSLESEQSDCVSSLLARYSNIMAHGNSENLGSNLGSNLERMLTGNQHNVAELSDAPHFRSHLLIGGEWIAHGISSHAILPHILNETAMVG